MKITAKQYANALFDLTKDKKEKEIKIVIDKFTKALVENNQVSEIKKILIFFSKLWDEYNNIENAQIISAYELDKNTLELVEEFAKKRVGDKKLSVKQEINKDLRGGFVVRVGDKILDLSLDSRIKKFKQSLSN